MTVAFYIKSVDELKGYVKSVSPLQYTTSMTDAHKIVVPLNDVDIDFIENELWDLLDKAIDETGSLCWQILILDNDTEERIANIDLGNDGLMLSINANYAKLDTDTELRLRNFAVCLSEYLDGRALTLIAQSMASRYTPVSGNTPTSTATAYAPQDDEADIDKLVSAIEQKTKASIIKPKETLADYVCNDALKAELEEIKDFFENSATYSQAGVRMPKGILFKGIPGTGKTYAARCIAGSVDCFFMSCTASSMQGMYIGSGAENIRQVFDAAKTLHDNTNKGVILFIDEIDSFGSRESHSGSSSGEEDRTLNQLLAEMSGFEDTDGIMVLAATNYPERIDDALLRSGRFSRQINIDVPEEVERIGLIQHYFNKISIPREADCDDATLAAITEGMTPADISEVSNEAGILTIRQKLSNITLDTVNEAINKVITKNIRRPDKSTEFHETVAIHEAGHVLAEYLYTGSYSIKVTNYSYGDAGGFTQPRHKHNSLRTAEDYKHEIMTLLGGRAAEETLLGKVSTGASEDFARAVKKIKAYFEVYHFEKYKVSELDQLVQDTLNEWYEECLKDFSTLKAIGTLKSLTTSLCNDRVLYTKEICCIIRNNY